MRDGNYQYGKIFRKLKYLEVKLEQPDLSPNKRESLTRDFELLKKRIPKLIYSPQLHNGKPYTKDTV